MARLTAVLREQTRIRPLQRDPLALLTDLKLQQGDLASFSLGRQRVIYLSSVELIEEAFVRRAASVGKWGRARRWWLRRPPYFVHGELFTTHDEDEHTRARRLFKPALSRTRARQDRQVISSTIERLLRERETRDGPFELSELAQALLVGGFLATAFDYEIPFEEVEQLVAARNRAKAIESRVFSSQAVDLLDLLRRPRRALAAAAALEHVTETHARLLVDRPGSRPTSLAALIAAARPAAPAKFAESLVVSLIDAPALLLVGWLALVSDPSLGDEIRADVSESGSETVRGLALESIRLGAGWLLGRLCQQPFELSSSAIRPGDWLLAAPHLVHRDERYWPDAERVAPARWVAEQVARRSRYSLLTFGVSTRICPGRHAVTEVVAETLAVVARNWELRLLTDPSVIVWQAQAGGGDVQASGPLPAILRRRDDAVSSESTRVE